MNPETKAKSTFIGAIIFAVFLAAFGLYLFNSKEAEFTNGEFFALGTIFILAGLVIASADEKIKNRLLIAFIILGIGVYMFGRASGVIKEPWMAYVAGAACLASAAFVIYVARPKKKVGAGPEVTTPEVPSERTERR